MNVKRFSARTSRDALGLVRQAFGDDAVVLSTRPCAEGVEVMAMAGESVPRAEPASDQAQLLPPGDARLNAYRAAADAYPIEAFPRMLLGEEIRLAVRDLTRA